MHEMCVGQDRVHVGHPQSVTDRFLDQAHIAVRLDLGKGIECPWNELPLGLRKLSGILIVIGHVGNAVAPHVVHVIGNGPCRRAVRQHVAQELCTGPCRADDDQWLCHAPRALSRRSGECRPTSWTNARCRGSGSPHVRTCCSRRSRAEVLAHHVLQRMTLLPQPQTGSCRCSGPSL